MTDDEPEWVQYIMGPAFTHQVLPRWRLLPAWLANRLGLLREETDAELRERIRDALAREDATK